MSFTISIRPYQYIHVFDKNSNICKVETGPQTYIKLDHETILSGESPVPMLSLSPETYLKIQNPVLKNSKGEAELDEFGQVKLNHGEYQYRFYEEYNQPFPLYPGEILAIEKTKLSIINENEAMRIKATQNFKIEKKVVVAGDEWLLPGPTTYYPRVEEEAIRIEQALTIKKGEALQLKATQDFKDNSGIERNIGEEWLIRTQGSYFLHAYEELVAHLQPHTLTKTTSIILEARQSFVDIYGIKRSAGSQWLITRKESSTHIIDVHEILIEESKMIVLAENQYCVILNPFDHSTNSNQLGKKILKKGEDSFFLYPGESLEEGIKNSFLLGEGEALSVKAKQAFTQKRFNDPILYESIKEIVENKAQEKEITLIKNERNGYIKAIPTKDLKKLKNYEKIYKPQKEETVLDFVQDIKRQPGEQWMEYGPLSYTPPIEIEVVRKVKEIPLDKNEGIYVRNLRTGEIRSHIGSTYMLQPYEKLWRMKIPQIVEDLLIEANGGKSIDKTRVISYKAPFNSAVQIYNYRKKESRIVYGPRLISLEPDEIFTVNVLSAGKPKAPGVIKSLNIRLGPEFTSDLVEVETSDHARLLIKLSYNWTFKFDKENSKNAEKVFSIKDFIGDMCTIMAAKIRSAVASVNFENFHNGFAKLIRSSVFGIDENGKIKDEYLIEENGLTITNVDIQYVEPVDQETKDSLNETVSLAIEITTKGQEEEARRESDRTKQEAEGELERLQISYESKAEGARQKLLLLQADSIQITNSGKANAQARAIAEVKFYFR